MNYKDIYLDHKDPVLESKLEKIIEILEEKKFVTYEDLEYCGVEPTNYQDYEAIINALSREGVEVLTSEEEYENLEEQGFEAEDNRPRLEDVDNEYDEVFDDLSDGGKDYDPMRMYMTEIGRVDLLKNRKEENIIFKQIESFHFNAIAMIVSVPFTLRQILSFTENQINDTKSCRLEDFVDGIYSDEEITDIIRRSNSFILSSLLKSPDYQFLANTDDTIDSYVEEIKEAELVEEKPLILGIKNTGNLDYTKEDSDKEKLEALQKLLDFRPLILDYINKLNVDDIDALIRSPEFQAEGEEVRNKLLRIRFATHTLNQLVKALLSKKEEVDSIVSQIETYYLQSVGRQYFHRIKQVLPQNYTNLEWVENEIEVIEDNIKLIKNRNKIISLQEMLLREERQLGLSISDFIKLANRLHYNQEASRRAKEKIVRANLRLVVSIASKYPNNNLPLSDRVQEGNCGLLKSIDKFNYRRGFKFSTYATWWIRQSVFSSLAEQSRIIRLPVHVIENIAAMKKILLEQEQKGIRLRETELVKLSNISVEKMRDYEPVAKDPVSIDYSVDSPLDEDTTSVGDFIEDTVNLTPEENFEKEQLTSYLFEPLKEELTDRELMIIKMRYGLDGSPEMDAEEIANYFEVTKERIRQIEAKVLKKLQTSTRINELRQFSGGVEVKANVENNEAKARRREMLVKIRTLDEVLDQRIYCWDDL